MAVEEATLVNKIKMGPEDQLYSKISKVSDLNIEEVLKTLKKYDINIALRNSSGGVISSNGTEEKQIYLHEKSDRKNVEIINYVLIGAYQQIDPLSIDVKNIRNKRDEQPSGVSWELIFGDPGDMFSIGLPIKNAPYEVKGVMDSFSKAVYDIYKIPKEHRPAIAKISPHI